jgi:Uma2 family endonuclease
MTITLSKPIPRFASIPRTRPGQKKWTVPQFHFLGDLGMFEGARAMLIDGVIIEEGPMNPPHRYGVEFTVEALQKAFAGTHRVCSQLPLVLGLTTDPEPDVAVIRGSARGQTGHPTTADLIVEISDTSLDYDTTEKMNLYAAAGIKDYWVVDVNARVLLVYRDPVADPSAPHGATYSTKKTLPENDEVIPLANSGTTVKVIDLLP